jgi:hypothetical protein
MPANESSSFASKLISFFGDPRKPEERKTLGQKVYWVFIALGLLGLVSVIASIPSGRATVSVIQGLLAGAFIIVATVAIGRKPRKPLAIGASVVLFVAIGVVAPASTRPFAETDPTPGASSNPTPGASGQPTPNQSSAPVSRCIAVSAAKLESILPLSVAGGTLRNGWAVRSADYNEIWFLAAEMDFPGGGEGNGQIGMWATGDLEPVVGFYSVNGFALEFSSWADGPASDAQLSMSDDGASEAEACVKSNQ